VTKCSIVGGPSAGRPASSRVYERHPQPANACAADVEGARFDASHLAEAEAEADADVGAESDLLLPPIQRKTATPPLRRRADAETQTGVHFILFETLHNHQWLARAHYRVEMQAQYTAAACVAVHPAMTAVKDVPAVSIHPADSSYFCFNNN
jgi:hypothetical protein